LEAFRRRSAALTSSSWSPFEDTLVFEVEDLPSFDEEEGDDTDNDAGGPDDDPTSDSRPLRFFIGNALLGKVVLLMAVVEVPPVNMMQSIALVRSNLI
jgi:hypothetical protein